MKNVPFIEPVYVTRPILPNLEDLKVHLEEIWESKILANNGPKHQQLEKLLSENLKVPSISLFNNGTIALITACQALKLTGEVITTPFTFPATPHVLSWNNLTPVFCDIDPETMNIDASKIEALINPKTSGILGVHVYGTPCEVISIASIAKKYNLKVIYDAAHAFGTEINGQGIGTFGDMTMFSFHATKLYHTIEGGCLTYNDSSLKSLIDLLKNFGIKNEDEVILPGINGKLNEMQSAVGILNLQMVEEEQKKRSLVREIYIRMLSQLKGIILPKTLREVKSSCQYFVIRVNQDEFGMSRDQLHSELKKYNVVTRKYFYPLCNTYDCYKDLPSAKLDLLPVAEQISREVLALPFYGILSHNDVEKICEIITYIQANRRSLVC